MVPKLSLFVHTYCTFRLTGWIFNLQRLGIQTLVGQAFACLVCLREPYNQEVSPFLSFLVSLFCVIHVTLHVLHVNEVPGPWKKRKCPGYTGQERRRGVITVQPPACLLVKRTYNTPEFPEKPPHGLTLLWTGLILAVPHSLGSLNWPVLIYLCCHPTKMFCSTRLAFVLLKYFFFKLFLLQLL